MSTYRLCDGPRGCGRSISVENFERASAHAPGCWRRRSALAKGAAAKRAKREERRAARKAARV